MTLGCDFHHAKRCVNVLPGDGVRSLSHLSIYRRLVALILLPKVVHTVDQVASLPKDLGKFSTKVVK